VFRYEPILISHQSNPAFISKMKFCSGVVDEIKKLWPGTILVTEKPRHSESNGGIEQQNRTVEEKIANWMHANKSTHRAEASPFIQ